jgi:DNA replication regulator DPB11
LASQAEQMGALHKYDLTSEITHLIVGDYDTPKYRYVAKERPDVKVLTPQWVEAVRQLWIEDQAIDVGATEREYTLPTFATLRICLTGFEDR